MQTQISSSLIRQGLPHLLSDKQFVNSNPDNQHFIENRKRKVFKNFEDLPQLHIGVFLIAVSYGLLPPTGVTVTHCIHGDATSKTSGSGSTLFSKEGNVM